VELIVVPYDQVLDVLQESRKRATSRRGCATESGRSAGFKVHGEVRHAHQGILDRLEVRRRTSAKALEQPGSFDLGDHGLCFRARDRAAPQGHIVVDLDHHAATAKQEHRAQLRVAGHANDTFDTFSPSPVPAHR
jgi:hypothetical protein